MPVVYRNKTVAISSTQAATLSKCVSSSDQIIICFWFPACSTQKIGMSLLTLIRLSLMNGNCISTSVCGCFKKKKKKHTRTKDCSFLWQSLWYIFPSYIWCGTDEAKTSQCHVSQSFIVMLVLIFLPDSLTLPAGWAVPLGLKSETTEVSFRPAAPPTGI